VFTVVEGKAAGKHTETALYDAMDGVCDQANFRVFKMIPPTMKKGCDAFMDKFGDGACPPGRLQPRRVLSASGDELVEQMGQTAPSGSYLLVLGCPPPAQANLERKWRRIAQSGLRFRYALFYVCSSCPLDRHLTRS
jgi:hypothetical protein